MKIVLTHEQIAQAAEEAYQECKNVKGGVNAHYIPYLANVNPNLFGLSVTLSDGTQYNYGDTDFIFGIESISKVPTAILVLRQYGAKTLLEKIGADATGLPFNSILAILLEKHQPSTPLVNAGAISACSMVKPVGDSNLKWKAIHDNICDLTGTEPEVIDELYRSESATNFNNRSIAWLLKNYDRIYDDPPMSLDLYTRQCSLGVTAKGLSTMAATIAFKGFNPMTQKRIYDPELSARITTMIAAVGFYQTTGDWMYRSGIPAKSGVGGGVLGVYPGVMGVAAFAPPLDPAGNSVKAQAAVLTLIKKLNLGVFNGDCIEVQ